MIRHQYYNTMENDDVTWYPVWSSLQRPLLNRILSVHLLTCVDLQIDLCTMYTRKEKNLGGMILSMNIGGIQCSLNVWFSHYQWGYLWHVWPLFRDTVSIDHVRLLTRYSEFYTYKKMCNGITHCFRAPRATCSAFHFAR